MATASLKTFARNLRYLMRVRNLTATDLSDNLDISESRISNWLSGNCYPKQEIFVRLCELLAYTDIFRFITEEIKIELANER